MQEVPWKECRRALVWWEEQKRWVEGYGICDSGSNEWLIEIELGQPANDPSPSVPAGGPTALLPNQCPECYEIDAHAEGCRTAANLAAGVSAFWARWARRAPPPAQSGVVLLALLDGQPCEILRPKDGRWTQIRVALSEWREDGSASGWAYVALGADGGPTIAPWGES